jgi:hypothetical protein
MNSDIAFLSLFSAGVGVGLTMMVYGAMADTDYRKQHPELKIMCAETHGENGAVLYLLDGSPLCVDWKAAAPKALW